MVPPPSWTALESSGLGRSASLSAGPRIQQVNEAAWPSPGWACANVSVAINRVIRMSRLLKLFRQTRYPSETRCARRSSRVIPTLKSGPGEALRLKRSVVSGPRLRRGDVGGRICLPHKVFNDPPFRRARVCLESLGTAEPDGVLEEGPRRGAVIDAEPGAHAQECVDREPAGRARRPTGREHVIRSRAVVAQDFRGSRTDEQRAVMAQPGRYGSRVPELELQVLRCNRVARRDPFV